MLKQKPGVYVALIVAFGGLLLAGVPVDRLLSVGFVALMLMMHLGGHGHDGHGHGGHEGPEPRARHDLRAPAAAPKSDKVVGK